VRSVLRNHVQCGFPSQNFFEARIFCPYDSFGRKFVESGEKHRDRKSGCHHNDNKTHRGIRNFKKREDLRCELGKEPCDYSVGDCCPVNITPLQLREDVLWFTLRALMERSSQLQSNLMRTA
jgi:hypothetical protein